MQVGEFYLEAVRNSAVGKMPRITSDPFHDLEAEYDCYDLLEQGPCEENERFLLKSNEVLFQITLRR